MTKIAFTLTPERHTAYVAAKNMLVACDPRLIRDWRQGMGLTKLDAAKALDISRSSLDVYENGEKMVPTKIALACYALALISK